MAVRILFDYLSFDPCEVLVVCGLAVEDDLVVWRFSNFFFSQSLLFGSVSTIFSSSWFLKGFGSPVSCLGRWYCGSNYSFVFNRVWLLKVMEKLFLFKVGEIHFSSCLVLWNFCVSVPLWFLSSYFGKENLEVCSLWQHGNYGHWQVCHYLLLVLYYGWCIQCVGGSIHYIRIILHCLEIMPSGLAAVSNSRSLTTKSS